MQATPLYHGVALERGHHLGELRGQGRVGTEQLADDRLEVTQMMAAGGSRPGHPGHPQHPEQVR